MRPGALVAGFFLVAAAAAAQGPAADWRTVETRHFRVHYPAPFEAWALHAAGEIEAIHAGVTGFVGHVPARKIEVVVFDPAGDSNGEAIPFLDRPEIVLWASPPESESSIGDYGDWMELVAVHEVAHIAHLARPRTGSAGILVLLSPAPFGPLALQSPRWVTEGYATLVEGELTASGRPNSSFRAMVLRQLAIEGKLPAYGALDGTGTWLGGSVAYLVGSAYLEWLAACGGPDSLPRLWTRMASSLAGTFSSAFRDVFGDTPEQLYDRFRAELSARALEEEKRLKAAGLAEGEPSLSLAGGTLAAQVSPDGNSLLARRDPTPKESFLAIWPITPDARELREAGASRKPRWTLPRSNGFSASDPRWLPGGRAVLFSRRAPDADGVLRWDLQRWDYERGAVSRVTCLADVSDADPEPGGVGAIAVRRRFGASTLVRVDLATGRTEELDLVLPVAEAWPAWSHPRVSPDGKWIAALLHAGRRWRLVTVPAGGGAAREIALAAPPVSAPAWSADGSRLFVANGDSGIWNLVAVDPGDAGAAPVRLTRVTGGAFGPAPSPDGRSLSFLDFTASGVGVRRLELSSGTPAPSEADAADAYPLRPRLRPDGEAFATAPVSAPGPYDVWQAQAVRPLLDFSFGPSGNSVQLGVDSGDVLGRVQGLAMGSMGDAIGPRGGSVAMGYRGLPIALTAQLFSAIEKPGNQGLAPRPAFDEERFGGFFDASWSRPYAWGRIEARAGAGGSRVEAFATATTLTRALTSAGATLVWRRTRGRSGFGFDFETGGSLGATEGFGWSQWAAGGRIVGILPFASLSASARYGDTWGTPSLFDLYAIGGAPSGILSPGLDANRIQSPALPADVQAGKRFEAFRAELSGASIPVVLYSEWLRAWSSGQTRPDPVRVVGAEVRLERLIPAEFGRTVAFHVGAGWIVSDTPSIHAGRGYAQLIYRP
jgi:hypothetical protein